MNIERLIIEVTRRCKCNCEHCMRGEEEEKDLDVEKFSELVDKLNVKEIQCIAFTGGEPFMATSKMKEVLEVLKKKTISMGSFLINTSCNFEVNKEDLILLSELYSYSDEKDYCALYMSDNFITKKKFNQDTLKKLSAFIFSATRSDNLLFKNRHINEYLKEPGFKMENLLNLGSATDNYDELLEQGFKFSRYQGEGKELFKVNCNSIEELTLTVDGKILPICDYSYDYANDIEDIYNISNIKNSEEFLALPNVEMEE